MNGFAKSAASEPFAERGSKYSVSSATHLRYLAIAPLGMTLPPGFIQF